MEKKFIEEAIALAKKSVMNNNGGPFGAVVVKDGKIVGRGHNTVTANNDPTSHAEIVAIRNACQNLNEFSLENCEIYTTCEPCPMCLGAIYWARLKSVYFAADRHEAAQAGFDDDCFYKEMAKSLDQRSILFQRIAQTNVAEIFALWEKKEDKISY